MEYRNALKFGAKSRGFVAACIADASNLLGSDKEQRQIRESALAKLSKMEGAESIIKALGINVSSEDKEVTRAVRAAYCFARASLIGALAEKYSVISDNDNRSNEQFLKLARDCREAMDTLKVDNAKDSK